MHKRVYELAARKPMIYNDKRNVYLDELSGIVDISYTTHSDKSAPDFLSRAAAG
jgi:flagellar hook-associated protein FlgK